MHPCIFPSSFLFLVIIIFTLDHLPTTFCQDAQYVGCAGRFQCANFSNLEYPFWGGRRLPHCGHPAFKLDCEGDVPLITLQSRTYRVLGIDSRSLLITVARQDLWNNTCPSLFYNTDLDYRIFSHPSSDQNLTLSYNCVTVPGLPYKFDCSVNGASSDNYFYTEAVLLTPNPARATCRDTIRVPINQTSANQLTLLTASSDELQEVLKAGFGLKWEANDSNCNECGRSGGRCGTNSSSSSFVCYCIDRTYPSRCNETEPGSPPETELKAHTTQKSNKDSPPPQPSRNQLTSNINSPMSATSLSHFPMHLPFLLLLLISAATPSFTADDSSSYPNCTNTFSCDPIHNITYPFTGGNRPTYCGPPQFHLTCPNNNTHPELTFNSLTYRVLHINQTHQTLTLARSDLFNTTCPQKFINATFNSSVFTVREDNVMLNLIYGCFSMQLNRPLLNVFSCNVNGVEFSDAYYFVGLVPVINFIRCAVSVVVPILGVAGERLGSNLATLDDVLTSGFRVNYSDPYNDECLNCSLSGGECGFLADPIRHVCICQNKLCVDEAGKQSKSSPKTRRIVISVVGVLLAGIAIGWLFFFCRQRRKQRIAQSATHIESKDLPATPSAKSLTTTTSTHFTKSTPSYLSSGFESGKGSTYFGVQVFSYTELEEATDSFNSSRELGDGGFGTVYYGTLQDGRVVAVKRLYENNFKRVEQFMNEVEILTKLNHKNLVKLYGCTSKRSRDLLLVYEYIPNGTVADHLHGKQANSGLISWSVRLKIAIETAEALAYLHVSGIIHRDVKSNNILLDNSFCVKVADFGLSRLNPNNATHVSTAPQGTPGYVDPEYYKLFQLTDKSDVYSFGVVLVELISSLPALDTSRDRFDINLASMAISKIQNQTINELIDRRLGFESNTSVEKMTTLVAELAFRCLQEEKDLRPTMQEVVETLKEIQHEDSDVQKTGVSDIVVEEVAPLKGKEGSFSPDSVADKWISNSTSIYSE